MTTATAAALLSVLGLMLTGTGAWITAKAVILSEDQALQLGLPRYASDNREENLRMPLVQGLLRQSRSAGAGLMLIVGGTAYQMVAALLTILVG